jgi:hypothetical protein
MPDRLCHFCGLPLPENLRWTYFYHPGECKRLGHNKYQQENHHKNAERKRLAKLPRHKADPMKRLGMDYVHAKLAELNINLEDKS